MELTHLASEASNYNNYDKYKMEKQLMVINILVKLMEDPHKNLI